MRSQETPDADFDNSQTVTPYEVSHGLDVYLGQNCTGCHRIGDGGGDTGADLTYIGNRLTPEEIRDRLKNPVAGSAMESHSFDFPDEKDLEDLVKYLSILK
ncbi:MAG: c-type cytochrome [bacterium]